MKATSLLMSNEKYTVLIGVSICKIRRYFIAMKNDSTAINYYSYRILLVDMGQVI